MKNLLPLIIMAAVTSGCVAIDKNRDFVRAQSESNPAGAKGLLRGNELRGLSIANLVGSFSGVAPADVSTPQLEQQATDKAIAEFYTKYWNDPERGAVYRNEIQSRIIAAANQRCQLWKNYIATASSSVGFWSGIVGAATGAASIAFSPEGTKDALTAVSTTANGIGPQFDKAYLFSQTMAVVMQGVDGRRAELYTAIVERRSQGASGLTPLKDYPLSDAIAHALEYHAACSIHSGLQQAAEKLADGRADGEEPEKPATPAPGGAQTPPAPTTASPPPAEPQKRTAAPIS